MQAKYTVLHAKYTGSSDSDGYPAGDAYDASVERSAYAIYPLSSQLNPSGEYDRRVITSKVVMVPDVSVYAPRDQVVVPVPVGDSLTSRTYFVSQDVRDYSAGPFGFKPSSDATMFGEIILEKVTG